MSVLPFKVIKSAQESFKVQVDRMPFFYDALHSHPEIQMTIIYQGTGKLMVADEIHPFQPGDIFIIGSNLPHVFRSDPNYYEKGSDLISLGISIFMNVNMMGDTFLSLPEMNPFLRFVKRSESGLKVICGRQHILMNAFEEMVDRQHFARISGLFRILEMLIDAEKMVPLSDPQSAKQRINEVDGQKLNAVYQFTMSSFHRDISIDEVAKLAGMTNSSFCRFFKKHTRKNYTAFLNEIRVEHACYLLLHSRKTIVEISRASGFNNLSHFNRTFKNLIRSTPKRYKEDMRQKRT